MNKYNERVLKNVLEDIREENDIKLQQEAEDAAANPLFANNDETDKRFQEALKEYEGIYIPKYVPEGYAIVSVINKDSSKTIYYENKSGQVISFTEHTQDMGKKLNLDKEDFDSYEVYQDHNRETIIATKSTVTNIVIKENNIIIHVIITDNNIDTIAFSAMIEKK